MPGRSSPPDPKPSPGTPPAPLDHRSAWPGPWPSHPRARRQRVLPLRLLAASPWSSLLVVVLRDVVDGTRGCPHPSSDERALAGPVPCPRSHRRSRSRSHPRPRGGAARAPRQCEERAGDDRFHDVLCHGSLLWAVEVTAPSISIPNTAKDSGSAGGGDAAAGTPGPGDRSATLLVGF